jgi:hypothetical protein
VTFHTEEFTMRQTGHLYRVLLAAIVLQFAGPGCKKPAGQQDLGTPLPKPTAKAENGWPLYEVTAEDFAIALPADWVGMGVSPQTMEEMIKQMAASNPGMGAFADTVRQQVMAGLKFFALDKEAAASGRGTNALVLKIALPPGTSLKEVVDLNVNQVTGLFPVIGPMKREQKKTSHGECERLDFTAQLNTPNGGTVKITQTQYYFASKTHYFVIAVTTAPEKARQLAETITGICESFRLINSSVP